MMKVSDSGFCEGQATVRMNLFKGTIALVQPAMTGALLA
jgi:hypothetical protein